MNISKSILCQKEAELNQDNGGKSVLMQGRKKRRRKKIFGINFSGNEIK
jgi:hypothetical protein